MTNPFSTLEQTVGGLRCAAVSDVGMRRSNNQDSMAIALAADPELWKSRGHLLVVADGMGAHAAGELASKMATDCIPHSYQKRLDLSPSEAILAAVREANDEIHDKGENSVDFQGMGTTCSCLLLLPQGALAAHVGDSRVYRLRGDIFEQLTFDHSLVWELAAAGHATEEDVPAYVPKNVITRSLGPHPTVAVDLEGPFDLQAGDRFLLCSDGLTGPLTPGLIGMVLSSLPLDEVPQSLVDLANLSGGPDNITVAVAEVVDPAKLGEAADGEDKDVPKAKRRSRRQGMHPLYWAGMAFCVLLGAVFAAVGPLWVPAVCALVFVGLAITGWTKRVQPPGETHSDQPIGRRGKAPYRRHECLPNAAMVATLADIVRQLEDLESHRDWEFDWQPILADRQQAHEAITNGKYEEAVVAYCSAVRRLMKSFRSLTPPASSDSNVNL
ncbi:MAG: serine/threonine-protein phosphatase [Planctomycetes bacterium]|nr:serine/threonine-protein phosphatase [Planctomycetota bacterium]